MPESQKSHQLRTDLTTRFPESHRTGIISRAVMGGRSVQCPGLT
jgi:hypothetical protein